MQFNPAALTLFIIVQIVQFSQTTTLTLPLHHGQHSSSSGHPRDVKLTCLLNLSEEKYDGGDLYLFNHKEVKVENFEPGSAVVFPSFLNHRVSEILKGSRNTLAIWMWGPKFR